jgi:uridine kinase
MPVTLIAIAGPSAGGKTTLARALAHSLAPAGAALLPMDACYRDLSAMTPGERTAWNFDAPDAFDWPLILEALNALLDGRGVDVPVYDFATHTRTAATQRIEPQAYLILEGLYALYREDVRSLCRCKVFVTLEADARLKRRVERDVKTRGRTHESVIHQLRTTVEPMFQAHIEPTACHADLILRGDAPMGEMVAAVMRQLGAG